MSRTAGERQVPRLMMVEPDGRLPLIDPRNAEAAESSHRAGRSKRFTARLQWAVIALLACVVAVQVAFLAFTLAR